MQQKISISIDEHLLNKVDSIIDGINIRKRSQAFEAIARSYFNNGKISKGVLLAALELPPKDFLRLNISNICNIGVDEIFIAAGKNNDKVKNSIESLELGCKVSCVQEDRLLGTAGALKLVEGKVGLNFVVMAGDTCFDYDLNKMVDFHSKNNNLATIGLTTLSQAKSQDNIKVDGNKIIQFEYMPKKNSYLTSAGIYIFSRQIFEYLPPKGSLEKDVFPNLSKAGFLSSFFIDQNQVKIL